MARSKKQLREIARAKKEAEAAAAAEAAAKQNSDAAAEKEKSDAAAAAAAASAEVPAAASTSSASSSASTSEQPSDIDVEVALGLKTEDAEGALDRICTANAVPSGRDIHLENFSLAAHGHELVVDSHLKLNWGRRYGLLGLNGCGKSTVMATLAAREVPLPDHVDVYSLSGEVDASDRTALQAILDEVDTKVATLEALAEHLLDAEGPESEVLQEVYARLDEFDVQTAPRRAGIILHGLGFDKKMQDTPTKDFSGGWRMRIALAKALFFRPSLLLLDEPTNHLDLEACVWLEEYLKTYDRILLLVSHSQDFLNNVCTNIIHLVDGKIKQYKGNFDVYIQTKEEKERHQAKKHQWEQEKIKDIKNYIARFGHGTKKMVRQAQSREKALKRMEERGLTEAVGKERVFTFFFPPCDPLPPPIIQFQDVTFGYSEDKILYRHLDMGFDLDSRVALVGRNGVGKSTLLKLITGDLRPLDGMVKVNGKLRIAFYHQHLTEALDLELSAVDFFMKLFPDQGLGLEDMRKRVGRFGLTGKAQMIAMKYLSDGQKSRVVFAWLAWQNPHMLLLDEPTNHLDIETIDSLAAALNAFNGGMVLVSHDFRLINQVADTILVCGDETVTRWNGDIGHYKATLRKAVMEELGEA